MSNKFVIVKVGDRYYDRELGKFLDHVQPTEKMYLVLKNEFQKKTQDEKAILISSECESDEFYNFANHCVPIIFGGYSKAYSRFGDIQYQIYDWVKGAGERFLYYIEFDLTGSLLVAFYLQFFSRVTM